MDAPAAFGGLSRLARRVSLRLDRHTRFHNRDVADALRAAIRVVADEVAARSSVSDARTTALEVQVARLAGQAMPVTGAAGAIDAESAAEAWRRRLEEDWARGVARPVVEPAVRLETRVGSLLVSSHDRVMLPMLRDEEWWEDEECEQLEALLRPGMTFVDIGAHVGFMSLLGARAVGPEGRVLAVEPSPANFDLLRVNLATNGMSHVTAVEAAALDRTASANLSLSPFNTGDHRAYPMPSAATVAVVGLALDDVIPPDTKIDVVKVDAQGTDHLAIRGMQATLRRSRSVLLVEYWPPGIEELGDDPLEVLGEYRDLGFDVRLLGADPASPPPSPAEVVEFALAKPGEFCSLLLSRSD